ncbi:MAG: hypothetical protein R3229_12885 [Alphaproteobacteria bacterium]|nr:hypothetical protein [Alphaproteobacteria bacterium]
MKDATDLLATMDADMDSDIPYRDDLKAEVFIADSEQEATARFDAWMNDHSCGKRNLVGVCDHTVGRNICVITALYWVSG